MAALAFEDDAVKVREAVRFEGLALEGVKKSEGDAVCSALIAALASWRAAGIGGAIDSRSEISVGVLVL